MTTEDMDDIKQFFTVLLSQTEERIKNELRQEMRTGFAGVADTIDTLLNHFDQRVSRLEAQAHTHPQPS